MVDEIGRATTTIKWQIIKKKEEINDDDTPPLSTDDLLRLMVMEYKVVDYITFMNDLRICDINWILPHLNYCNRQQLENTRFICYVIAQSNSTKMLKPSDIMTFEWDEKEVEKKKINITKDDVERIKTLAIQREKEIKNITTHKNIL